MLPLISLGIDGQRCKRYFAQRVDAMRIVQVPTASSPRSSASNLTPLLGGEGRVVVACVGVEYRKNGSPAMARRPSAPGRHDWRVAPGRRRADAPQCLSATHID